MLTAVSGGATVMFAYDPIGRLTTTATPASTTFLYDSDRLSAEYSAVGAVLRRYVHGPGVDEPLVWYEGAGTTDRRWLHQDRQGSVIGWSNGSGTVSASTIYKYGPWGEPGDAWGAGSRFRYTGQIAIPEARLYHYKARMYDPATGRFMQTDPIGYKDDLDLYAYVGGDPVNRADPTGTKVVLDGPEDWTKKTRAVLRAIRALPGSKAFIDKLYGSKRTITIRPTTPDDPDIGADAKDPTKGSDGRGSDATIYFDPDKRTGAKDDSGSRSRPPEVSLGHELGHGESIIDGSQPRPPRSRPGTPGTTPPWERNALSRENEIREALGLPPRSTYYPPE